MVATGYHRPGQLLRCSTNNHEDTLIPYDAPCIVPQPAHGSSFILAEPRKPDSVVGMHRGGVVYIQSNDRWVKTRVPDVDVIHVHNEGCWKP